MMEQPQNSFEEQPIEETSPQFESKEKKKKKSKTNTLAKIAAIGLALSSPSSSGPEKQTRIETWEQMKDRAKIEMIEKGITSEQKKAYKIGLNDLIYRGINPQFTIPDNNESWEKFALRTLKDIFRGRQKDKEIHDQLENNPGEEDAWRLYLGLPQKYNTFSISDYRPSHSKENKYYYKINSLKEFFHDSEFSTAEEQIKEFLQKFSKMEINKSYSHSVLDVGMPSKIMSNFQISRGHDEKGYYVSYYDIYDLKVPIENEHGLIGKPFEIYDRIYYNPETFEIINP